MIETPYSKPDLAAGLTDLTLRDELKAGTTPAHRDLERALNLLRADFSLADYRRLLVRYYGFYVPFERFLHAKAHQQSAAAQFYCGDRLKRTWLETDLLALDIDFSAYGDHIPDERFTTLFPSEEHILGAVYVIEGSMLGGAILSKHVMKRLQITPEAGLRFFSGYGLAAEEKWLATLQFLRDCDQPNLSRPNALDGAGRMFLLLKQHLANAPASY